MSVTFLEAIQLFYKRWLDFDGRSSRSEYWYAFLYLIIADVILYFIGSRWLSGLFGLINIIPYIAVILRRLHDIGKSGWWILVSLIPFIGQIWLLILMATPSKASSGFSN